MSTYLTAEVSCPGYVALSDLRLLHPNITGADMDHSVVLGSV